MMRSAPGRYLGRAKVLVLLSLLAYLGFYVFGLVMGVFSPFEIAGLSLLALLAVLGVGAIWIRERVRSEPAPELVEAERQSRLHRERRGF